MRSIVLPFLFTFLVTVHGFPRAEPGRVRTAVTPRSEIKERRTFILSSGQRQLDLGMPFVVSQSDSLVMDGRALMRGDDYRINTLKGTVILVEPAAGGERLVVTFARYPFSFSPVFTARFPEGEATYRPVKVTTEQSGKREEKRRDPYGLRLSGNKTVGFSVGSNKGLGIDQSLRVTMMGKVAKDLEVKASLSDDNLPVRPEGNTEELKYIDKVYVQVKSKHSEVQLGDFTTGINWTRFSSFQRELKGAGARVDIRNQSLFAGGGIAKGRFQTASFFGQEGVQGPYELLSARRFNGVIIVPGTETVYLDGRLLKRGSENDYTVAYDRGTVTFTEKVTVTGDSEIVIDFQTSEDDYERTNLTGGWTSSLMGGALTIKTFYFQESDNSDKPLRFTLTEDNVDILGAAGNDPEKAVASGVTQVEPGKGDYILVPGDTIPSHFEFVESGGDYIIDFYEVGPGNGDYRVDGFSTKGTVIYAFAGTGEGDYAVGKPLPLPERKQLFSLVATGERGHLYAETEGNVSLHDRNTLSGIDDENNAGGAMRFEGGIRELPISSTKFSLIGRFSSLDDRFTAPDKPRESYFYRNWSLEDVSLVGREDIGGATIRWRGERLWRMQGSYQYLSRGSDLTATKSDIGVGLGDMTSRGLSVKAFASEVGEQRDRRFIRGEGVLAFWHLVPRLAVESEQYRSFIEAGPDTGRYYREGIVSLAGRQLGSFNANVTYKKRRTDHMGTSGGQWFYARDNDEVNVSGSYRGVGSILEMFITYRRNHFVESGISDSYSLARFRYRDSWGSGAITTDIGYRLSSGEERTRQKTVVYVGENQGDFDSEGREVGKKRGDYMVLYLPGEEREPVRSVELSWRLSVGEGVRGLGLASEGGGVLGRLRRNVSFDLLLSVLEKSTTDDLFGLYTLSPSLLQSNEFTLYGVNRIRQEWSLFNDVKKFNLLFTYSREDEEDNRAEGAPAERFSRDMVLRAEAVPVPSVMLSWDIGAKVSRKESASSSEQNYDVETLSTELGANYRIRHSTRLMFNVGLERRLDAVTSAEQLSVIATPSVNSTIGSKIHVASFVKFTFTKSQEETGKPLFFLEEGLREDWGLSVQYRLTRYVSFGANYTGRREKDYRGEVGTIHDLRMESRAHF